MNIRKYLDYPILPLILSIIVSLIDYVFITTAIPLNLLLFFFQYVAFSVILERHTILIDIEKLLKKERGTFFVDRKNLPGLSELIDTPKKSIWIEAVSYGKLCGSDRGLLIRKYDEGCKIKILLLNPVHAKEASLMIQNLDVKTIQNQIEDAIRFLSEYRNKKSEKGGTITGKLLPSTPGFGIFIMDGDTDNGEVKVELMPCGTLPAEGPNVIITKSQDPKRYKQFIEHFNKIWEKSDPIP